MDLKINKSTGVLGLIEFKSSERRDVYFENSFGIIKESKLLFYNSDMVLNVNDVAGIKLVKNKSKSYLITRISILIAFSSLLLLDWNMSLLLICFTAIISLVFFKNSVRYSIRIKFSDNQQKPVYLETTEIHETKKFIKKFSDYKTINTK